MKISSSALAVGAISVRGAAAWGSFGHITTAYVASHLVSNTTEAFFKELLGNQDSDYLAKVAPWADSIRYSDEGRWSKNLHFIDAHDTPPTDCSVKLDRDCKGGCVISALQNFTQQSLDHSLSVEQRNVAAKFVIHFIGDMHQPLHNENTALGGNRIYVHFDTHRYNLHHVWDSSIVDKLLDGTPGMPHGAAARSVEWSSRLASSITDGEYTDEKESWLKDLDLNDPVNTALAWSSETNKLVCKYVLPEGEEAIRNQELGGAYYEAAAPVVQKQIAKAGYRMAAYLDKIVEAYQASSQMSEEL